MFLSWDGLEFIVLCVSALLGAALLNFIFCPEFSFIGLLMWCKNRNTLPLMGNESLIGMSATVERPFVYFEGEQFPTGYVRMNGELWNAQLHEGVAIPAVGTSVTVEAINGLVVTVKIIGETKASDPLKC
jgi:membrane protein implicated in regulation of membrane protease activity